MEEKDYICGSQKSTHLKPIEVDMTDPPLGYVVFKCPTCGEIIDSCKDDGECIDYCEYCGQKILWEN